MTFGCLSWLSLALSELHRNHEFRTFKAPTLVLRNGLSTSDLFGWCNVVRKKNTRDII